AAGKRLDIGHGRREQVDVLFRHGISCSLGGGAGLHSPRWLSRPTLLPLRRSPTPTCRPACNICGPAGSTAPSPCSARRWPAAAERELIEFVAKLDQAIEQGGEGLKPLQARARNMLGYALYRLGHHSSAIEVLDLALIDAGEDPARRGQILGDRALALSALGH